MVLRPPAAADGEASVEPGDADELDWDEECEQAASAAQTATAQAIRTSGLSKLFSFGGGAVAAVVWAHGAVLPVLPAVHSL